ncbi:hypothetical protein [Roseateles amylovorans]|uniref:Uncharacterized protein n=1 Tax=Roseateles amylovorans TaxID=2978473 RepID=A0ABY6B4G2_9BURK|nr:hypothetical protein [Roseateles amylovorans]UXH80144.1 hypothetical protein N4261_09790 [Roseateles amylovorans]
MGAYLGWLPAGVVLLVFAALTVRSVRRAAAWERDAKAAAAAAEAADAAAEAATVTATAAMSDAALLSDAASPALPVAATSNEASDAASDAVGDAAAAVERGEPVGAATCAESSRSAGHRPMATSAVLPPWARSVGTSERTYHGLFGGVARHFNGDYPLARSYWIHGVLLGTLAQMVLLWLSRASDETLTVQTGSMVVVALVLIQLSIAAWALIGTWRSAGRHTARGGSAGWALAARVMVGVGLVRLLAGVAETAPAMEERLAYLSGKQVAGGAATVTPLVGGGVLLLSGGINDGTAMALRSALLRHPNAHTLVLESGGGWVREGTRLAEVIRSHRLNTYVEGVCASSCTIALLAGQERTAGAMAKVGFHAARGLGASPSGGGRAGAANPADDSAFGQIYRQAGLPEDFIRRALSTPFESMWFPEFDQLLKAKVLTRVGPGGEWPLMATRFKSREDASAWLKEMPQYGVIAERFPTDYERALTSVWTLSQQQAIDQKLLGAARSELRRTLDRVRPLSSDALLIDYLALIQDQLRVLQERDARACVGLVFPYSASDLSSARLLTPELRSREQALILRQLREADPTVKPDTRQDTVVRIAQRAMAGMPVQQMQIMASEAERRSRPPELVCRAVIGYFDGLARIPAAERGAALRSLFAAP